MSKRVMQHQLEDLSRNKYGLVLPSHWVFRDKNKDYGIDGEVEIFNSEGKATGLVYWVQLKATESGKEATIKSVDLSLEKINYYKRLDVPVLLVRYSSEKDSFYIKWASEVDHFFAKDGAKTMRVRFSDSDIWDEKTAQAIEEYLFKVRAVKSGAIKLPLNACITFGSDKIRGVGVGVLLNKIRLNLDKYRDILSLVPNKDKAIADIHLDSNTLKVGIAGMAGCIFHSVNLMDKSTLPSDLIKDISLGLSVAVTMLGYSDLAARIIFHNDDMAERLMAKPDIIRYIRPGLRKTSYFDDVLDLVGAIIDNEENNLLEIIAGSAVLLSGDHDRRRNSIEKFLIRNSERYRSVEPGQYGTSMYNLGNFYRSIDRQKEAVKCYSAARRYEHKYYDQEYFFGELAGSLFELGKYRSSSDFYKKAIDFHGHKEWRPQYADALMFAGEYRHSCDVFEDYLSNKDNKATEWVLKATFLKNMIRIGNTESQIRQKEWATSLADIGGCEDDEARERLDEALRYDLLCGLAWYNLGKLKLKENEKEEAAFCFTVCSLVQPRDIEAWINATLLSFNTAVPIEIFILIVKEAYFFNRDKYLKALYDMIDSQAGEKPLEQISAAIEKIVEEESYEKPKPELRFLDIDGKFKNIANLQSI